MNIVEDFILRNRRVLADQMEFLMAHAHKTSSLVPDHLGSSCHEHLPQAEISFDRCHVVALANEAMDEVRREELRAEPAAMRKALGAPNK